jgi:hypothetical protein
MNANSKKLSEKRINLEKNVANTKMLGCIYDDFKINAFLISITAESSVIIRHFKN